MQKDDPNETRLVGESPSPHITNPPASSEDVLAKMRQRFGKYYQALEDIDRFVAEMRGRDEEQDFLPPTSPS